MDMHAFADSRDRLGPALLRLEREGPSRYTARTDPAWWNQIGPYGGWLAALAMAAMRDGLDDDWLPRSIAINFLGALPEGEIDVHVATLRRQRSVIGLRAELSRRGEPVAVSAEAVFGLERPSCERAPSAAPALPAPHTLPRETRLDGLAAFVRAFDYRLAWGAPWSGGDAADSAGWIRPARPMAPSPELLLMLADAWFPPGWVMLDAPLPVSTVSMQVAFHAALPPPGSDAHGYFAARHRSDAFGSGYALERGELWWPGGVLALQAQQLTWVGQRR